jgi:single-strand DNA-binding protein
MAVKVPITVRGNLGADPEPGVTSDGRSYAKLMVMENDRQLNTDTNEWEDVGEPVFHNAVVFGAQAENVLQSLHKGNRVVVAGDLHFQPYEKEGQRRQGTQIIATAVAPSLEFATASVQPNPKAPSPEASATGPVATPETSWAVASIQP